MLRGKSAITSVGLGCVHLVTLNPFFLPIIAPSPVPASFITMLIPIPVHSLQPMTLNAQSNPFFLAVDGHLHQPVIRHLFFHRSSIYNNHRRNFIHYHSTTIMITARCTISTPTPQITVSAISQMTDERHPKHHNYASHLPFIQNVHLHIANHTSSIPSSRVVPPSS